jgi:hypothetical protein
MGTRIDKTVRRWLFNILAAVSLLLCMMIAVIWERSYTYLESYRQYSSENKDFWYIVVVRGGLQVAHVTGLDVNHFPVG